MRLRPPQLRRLPGPITVSRMYVSLSRLRVPAERAPELVTAFRGRLHKVDDADGFVDLQVWQSDRDPGTRSGDSLQQRPAGDPDAISDYLRHGAALPELEIPSNVLMTL